MCSFFGVQRSRGGSKHVAHLSEMDDEHTAVRCGCLVFGGSRFSRRKAHTLLRDEHEPFNSTRLASSNDAIQPMIETESARSPVTEIISSPRACTSMRDNDPTAPLLDPDLLTYPHTAASSPLPWARGADLAATSFSPPSSLLAPITSPRLPPPRREVRKPQRGPSSRSRNTEVSPPPPRRVWTPRTVPNTPSTPNSHTPFDSGRPPLILLPTSNNNSNKIQTPARSAGLRTPVRPSRSPNRPDPSPSSATDIVRPQTAPPSGKRNADQRTNHRDSDSASAVISPLPPPIMANLCGGRHIISPRDDARTLPSPPQSPKGNPAASKPAGPLDVKIPAAHTPEGTSLITTGSGDFDETEIVAALSSPSHSESTPLLNSFLASFSEMPSPRPQSTISEHGPTDLRPPASGCPPPPSHSPRPANPLPPSPTQRPSEPSLPTLFVHRTSQPLASFPIRCLPDRSPPSPSSRPSDPLPPSPFQHTFEQPTSRPLDPLPPSPQGSSSSSHAVPDHSYTGSVTCIQLIAVGTPLSTAALPLNRAPIQSPGHGCSVSLQPSHSCDINLLSFDNDNATDTCPAPVPDGACSPHSPEPPKPHPDTRDSAAAALPNPTDPYSDPDPHDPYDTLCLPATGLAVAVSRDSSMQQGLSGLSGLRQPAANSDFTRAAASIDALFATMEAAEGASGSKEELHLHCSMDEFIAQIFEQAGHSGGNGGNSGPLCAGSELAGEMAPDVGLSSISDPGRMEAAATEWCESDSMVNSRIAAMEASERSSLSSSSSRPRDPFLPSPAPAPVKPPPRWSVSVSNAASAAAYAATLTPRLTPLPSPHADTSSGKSPFGMAPRTRPSAPRPGAASSIEDSCLAQMECNSDSGSGTASPTHMSDVAACLSLDRSQLAGSEYGTKRPLLTPRAECLGAEPLEETPVLETYRSRATLSPRAGAHNRRSLGRTLGFSVSFSETVVARIYSYGAPPVEFAETSAEEARPLLTRDGPRPGWESEKYMQRAYASSDSDSDSNQDWDSFR